jgi:hypothetical protein
MARTTPNQDDDKTADTVPLRMMGQGFGLAWCWQEKKARRAIRENLKNGVANALLVYDALTEILSDIGREIPAKIPLSVIASMAGRGQTATREGIDSLKSLGLIHEWEFSDSANIYAILGLTFPDEVQPPRGSVSEYAKLENSQWVVVTTPLAARSPPLAARSPPLAVEKTGKANPSEQTKERKQGRNSKSDYPMSVLTGGRAGGGSVLDDFHRTKGLPDDLCFLADLLEDWPERFSDYLRWFSCSPKRFRMCAAATKQLHDRVRNGEPLEKCYASYFNACWQANKKLSAARAAKMASRQAIQAMAEA